MEADFWHQRWQENRIGFHQREVNPYLRLYWSRLALVPGTGVFVPLCGKSLDMRWLQQNRYPVIGVELSCLAVRSFFEENHLTPVHHQAGTFSVFEADDIRLYCGDFFDLDAGMLDAAGAVYDRASLIALPSEMRPAFVAKLSDLSPPHTPMMLVSMEYDQSAMQGPPFAVEEGEVRALFAQNWSVQLLHKEDILAREPRFRERGLSRLNEKIYLLKRLPV